MHGISDDTVNQIMMQLAYSKHKFEIGGKVLWFTPDKLDDTVNRDPVNRDPVNRMMNSGARAAAWGEEGDLYG